MVDIHDFKVLYAVYIEVFPEDAEQDDDRSVTNDELDEYAVGVDDRSATDTEIKRLSKLTPIEYDRERKTAAERLGIGRLGALDAAVKAARAKNESTTGQGRPIELCKIEPWPEPVNGAELLDEIAAIIKKFVVVSEVAADAVALWCVGTHAFGAFSIFPRLTLQSATPRCGKTTLRDVVSGLVSKPLSTDSILPAALFRTIEVARPTLLLDEAETYLRDNEALRGIINSGHRKDGCVIRCVGDDHDPRAFSTWAPMLLAQIGKPPATVYDRSVVVTLRRKKPNERVESLRPKARRELHTLARKVARWAQDNATTLEHAEPGALDFLNDRANDNWQPLLAVADLAGGHWQARAHNAARSLSENSADDGVSDPEILIGDIRWIFDGKPEERDGKTVTEYESLDKMSSTSLTGRLSDIEGRRWGEWKGGKHTPIGLARELAPFGIAPGTIRMDGGRTLKGYKRADFSDVFARYPAAPRNRAVTPSQPNSDGHCDASQSVTGVDGVTASETSQPNKDGHCDGVTVREPLPNAIDEEEAAWTV